MYQLEVVEDQCKVVLFVELEPKSIFKTSDGLVWMKMDSKYYNAACLSNGVQGCFNPDEQVYPRRCTLVFLKD